MKPPAPDVPLDVLCVPSDCSPKEKMAQLREMLKLSLKWSVKQLKFSTIGVSRQKRFESETKSTGFVTVGGITKSLFGHLRNH